MFANVARLASLRMLLRAGGLDKGAVVDAQHEE